MFRDFARTVVNANEGTNPKTSTVMSVRVISFVLILLSSCVPLKKTQYMRIVDDADTLSVFVNERKIDYRVPGSP